jgi:hypothetical protein
MVPLDEITCIFCAQRKKPSREHIIPKSLGGNLVINDLCKECNDLLGRIADSAFDANSYIAAAYKELGWQGQLAKIIAKAEVKAIDTSSLINMKLRVKNNDEFQIVPQELKDGSLIVGEEQSIEVINKMVERRKEEYIGKGLTKEEIEYYKEELIRRYEKSDPGIDIDSPKLGFTLIKHSSELVKKVEYSKNIPVRGICKIGYELLFFVIGHRCLDPRFDSYRKYPMGEGTIPLIYQLFPSNGKPLFSPIHQLSLVEKDTELIGNVRLFRGYAWEISFGPNDFDAFKAYGDFPLGRKVDGVGMQIDVENNTTTVFMRIDSVEWKQAGIVS